MFLQIYNKLNLIPILKLRYDTNQKSEQQLLLKIKKIEDEEQNIQPDTQGYPRGEGGAKTSNYRKYRI